MHFMSAVEWRFKQHLGECNVSDHEVIHETRHHLPGIIITGGLEEQAEAYQNACACKFPYIDLQYFELQIGLEVNVT